MLFALPDCCSGNTLSGRGTNHFFDWLDGGLSRWACRLDGTVYQSDGGTEQHLIRVSKGKEFSQVIRFADRFGGSKTPAASRLLEAIVYRTNHRIERPRVCGVSQNPP